MGRHAIGLCLFLLISVRAPAQTAVEPVPAVQPPKPASRPLPRRTTLHAHYLSLSGVSWRETNEATISGVGTKLDMQVQGVNVGYTWYRVSGSLRLMTDVFIEALQSHANARSSLTFSQRNIPTYAAGAGLTWVFFARKNTGLLGLGARTRYRLIDLEKPADSDVYPDRAQSLSDVNLQMSWMITPRFSLLQEIATSVPDQHMQWRLGVRWRIR